MAESCAFILEGGFGDLSRKRLRHGYATCHFGILATTQITVEINMAVTEENEILALLNIGMP